MTAPLARRELRGGALLRGLTRLAAPGGRRGRFVVLIYHRVLAEPDPLRSGDVDAATFEWHMATLVRCFRVLPLGEAIDRLRAGTLPARAAAVTFDDGYADNCEQALPILQRYHVPATFFVTTGALGGCNWNDVIVETVRACARETLDATPAGLGRMTVQTDAERRAAIEALLSTLKEWRTKERDAAVEALASAQACRPPSGVIMDRRQLARLARAGMDLGAHTVNHPILTRTEPGEAEDEIHSSRATLEAITGSSVRLFAYPYGRPGADYDAQHVELVRRLGFAGAVSTAWGANVTGRADPFQLKRFTPWDRTPERFAARLLLQCVQG